MRKFLCILFLALLCWPRLSAVSAVSMGESLNYRVMYKWGLVNKQAGHVNLTTTGRNDGKFDAKLTAATEKWADRFYKVRDTLQGTLSRKTFEPDIYEKITHEGGDYKYDRIDYQRNGNITNARCYRLKQKRADKPPIINEITLQAEGLTLDMLSSFYYMRSLDFAAMHPGEEVILNVFSGKRKELLTITYIGEDSVDINKVHYPAYHIRFRFTGELGKKTSDDMDAWISTESSHIPLKLEGKLTVGKVQCFFIP